MKSYQIFILAWFLFNIGHELGKDGQPRSGNHSFVLAIAVYGFIAGLLYWMGFFE